MQDKCMRSPSRWFAWWYLTIALGFALLAIYHALLGEKAWLVAIRVVVAAGFAILSIFAFGEGQRRP